MLNEIQNALEKSGLAASIAHNLAKEVDAEEVELSLLAGESMPDIAADIARTWERQGDCG